MRKTLTVSFCQNIECMQGAFSEAEQRALRIQLQDKYEVLFSAVEKCKQCDTSKIELEISSIFQDLTFKEFKILGLFMSDPNQSVSRQVLLSTLWADVKVGPKTLDVHLFNLRRKIRPKGYDLIHQGTGIWKLEKVD